MTQKTDLNKLLCECQSLRQDAEIDIERVAEYIKRKTYATKQAFYLVNALQKLHDLELKMDKLAATGLSYEDLVVRWIPETILELEEETD